VSESSPPPACNSDARAPRHRHDEIETVKQRPREPVAIARETLPSKVPQAADCPGAATA
jgi:hypothetical protein